MSPTDPTQLTPPASTPPTITATPSAVPSPAPATTFSGRTGWASLLDLNGYHWFVFVVAALGWLADCMDQQLFVLARENALMDLLKTNYDDSRDGHSRRLCDFHLPDGLGHGRSGVWHHGRRVWPGADHDADHPAVLDLYRAQCSFGRRDRLHGLPLPDRSWGRRRICRGGCLAGRNHARQRPPVHSWSPAGLFGSGQRDGRLSVHVVWPDGAGRRLREQNLPGLVNRSRGACCS